MEQLEFNFREDRGITTPINRSSYWLEPSEEVLMDMVEVERRVYAIYKEMYKQNIRFDIGAYYG